MGSPVGSPPTVGPPEGLREFLARPLWTGIATGLDEMVSPWRNRMLELAFLDLFNSYMAMLFIPNRIKWDIAFAEITNWAQTASPSREKATSENSQDKVAVRSSDVLVSEFTERRPSLRMLADVPLDDDAADLLNFKPYATALAGLIDDPKTSTPLVLSVNAPWGAGKTTLARMIERILKRKPSAGGDKPHVTCWFNAWMHDDAPSLASAFAAEVAQSADSMRTRWRRFVNPLPFSLRRLPDRRKLTPLLILADIALLCVCVAEYLALVPSWVGLTASATTTAVLSLGAFARQLGSLAPFGQAVAKFVSDPKATAATASMEEVRKELSKLIDEATPKNSRFIIFVDDLERCRPPRAVDVLEVVNQLLGDKRIVTLVLGDMLAIAACADIKYADLARRYAPGAIEAASNECGYGRAYLQKIIQLQFDLPIQSASAMQALIKELAITSFEEADISETQRYSYRPVLNLNDIRQVIDKEIESSIKSRELDLGRVETAASIAFPGGLGSTLRDDLIRERVQLRLGDDSELMREAQEEVMKYAEPMPRHAKRLLNRLRLLLFIATTLQSSKLPPFMPMTQL